MTEHPNGQQPNEADQKAQEAMVAAATAPRPIPNQVLTGILDLPQGKWVAMVVKDATGERHVYLEPDSAAQVGKVLIDLSRQARSGLIVPPGLLS